MGKRKVQDWHALLMYNADEQRINGTASQGTVDQARALARSTLRLTPSVAFIDIHVCDAAGRLASQAVCRVDWDQDWAAQ